MSKVALRVYNRDIEALIDQGHLDEAIAHCKHVLKTYPKYLEAYRLLGKAYLEARRFSDAADIFQRVLLAVPDDFISHLGMSIVSDEKKDLDRAIWHMERAYEISPSNAGVQNELRRLYGRRDGLEPPKIRLTRGALAQMYTKGGQYQQAIVEIKAVLAEDPARNDLKILLARAYFRAGIKVEATEICTELLRQYPYSLDANRILIDILPGTSLAGSVEQYKKRVQALDPYAGLVAGSLFEVDGVPDAAISVERLDYDTLAAEAGWQATVSPAPAMPEIQPSTENLPDWMKQAGWGPSAGIFEEGPVNFEEPASPVAESPAAGLAEAEIPDWLKAMAPASEQASQPTADQSPAAEDLDWLAGLGGPLAGSAGSEADAAPAESETSPDWMQDNLRQATIGTVALSDDVASAEDDLDWLNNLSAPQDEKHVAPHVPTPADIPDWLSVSGLGESQPATPTAKPVADWLGDLDIPKDKPPAQPQPVADWLKDLTPVSEEQPLSALVSGPGTSEAEQDEALKWLESLAAKQGAKPEELLTRPEERTDNLPDWVDHVTAAPVQPAPAAPELYIPEKPIEVEAEPFYGDLSPVSKSPGTGPLEQDEAMKWLESLAEKQGAKEDELITAPGERSAVAPSWLGDVQNPPTELSALVSGPGTSESEQDDALKWLESLAMKQGAKPEELITKPEERHEELPDWVAKVGEPPIESTQPMPEMPAEEASPSEVDAWFSSLAQPDQASPTPMPWEIPASETPAESVSFESPAAEASPEAFPWESDAEETAAEPKPWEIPASEAPAESVSFESPAAEASLEASSWKIAAKETQTEPLPWETFVAETPAAEIPAVVSADAVADVSDWLKNLDEPHPAAPVTPDTEELPDWLKDMSADDEPPAPAPIPEWKPVDEGAASQVVAVETAAQVTAMPEPAPQTPLRLRSTSSLRDKDVSFINDARGLLDKGSLDDAMSSYTKLIKKGKLLEEVLEDLNEIVYRHPVDVIVWQTMGDAYMRSNRLQEALDAYTKAEELLRR